MKITNCGGVYIAKYYDDKIGYKIGKSNCIKSRFESLNTSVPIDYELAYVIYPTDENKYNSGMLLYIEQSLHKILVKYRVRPDREFFTIPNENLYNVLVDAIKYFSDLNFNVAITDDEKKLKHIHETRPDISEDPGADEESGNTDAESENKELEYKISVEAVDASKRRQINTHQFTCKHNTYQSNTCQPKPHQIPALNKIHDHYDVHERGLLVLPPGYGKSYITSFLIRKNGYKSVLILVPYDKICQDFKKALIDCGVKNVFTELRGSSIKLNKLLSIDSSVYVMTYQSYLSNKKILQDSHFYFIVYDEAHHLVTGSEWSGSIQIRSNKKLFLTATPKITELNEDGKVNVVDGVNQCYSMDDTRTYGKIIHEETIEECIKKGLLCNYKLYVCDHDDGLYSICDELINLHHRKRIILFFNTVKKSKEIAKEISTNIKKQKLNWLVYEINGNTTDVRRTHIFDAFDIVDNQPKIICNVNVISEGANLVLTDSIVFAERRNSPIGIIQNIGRALRTHPTKDFAMIVMPKHMDNSMTVINALRIQDSRVTHKQMLIGKTSNTVVNNLLIKLYNKCNLIEVKNKKTTVKEFISMLKSQNIFSDSEYRRRFSPDFDEPYVEDPEEFYSGFTWNKVLSDQKFLTIDDAKKEINTTLDDEKIQIELKKIFICSEKYQYLRKLNVLLPPDPLSYYNIKKYNELDKRLYERIIHKLE